jgi:glycosyltransferase involved in cell wall biosynthesis
MAEQFRALGVDATLVVITSARPLSDRLDERGPAIIELGLPRGGELMRVARRYATVLRRAAPDGALLMTSGYMATMLRLGGYRGPLVSVEHGHVLQTVGPRARRWLEWLDLQIGARCVDAQVAVSSFTLEELKRLPHHRGASVIPNGVDLDRYRPERPVFSQSGVITIGWAGRLIPGKGVDDLVKASARVTSAGPYRVLIAGDGPERERLSSLATNIAKPGTVEFVGTCQDMPSFWNKCDLVVATSNQFVESFGLAPLEAAACGRPVVATRNGGFVDVVRDGETGRIIPPGDVEALACAISQYLADPRRAREDGERARVRATESFDIRACAVSYVELLGQVAIHRRRDRA